MSMPPGDAAQDTLERLDVTDEYDGVRLDHYITAVLPERSRSQIQRLIRADHVRLNRKSVRASHTVHPGDVVELEIPAAVPATPTAEALPLTILHDDADLVVVNKPPGMVVHPAAGHESGTLVNRRDGRGEARRGSRGALPTVRRPRS